MYISVLAQGYYVDNISKTKGIIRISLGKMEEWQFREIKFYEKPKQ
jgi:hypothetical protein